MKTTPTYYGTARIVSEWSFESPLYYADPFDEVEIDVLIENETFGSWRVPAFWAGGSLWRVRFAAPTAGNYSFATVCNQQDDENLHNVQGRLEIAPAAQANPLADHGLLGLSADKRSFAYADGTPFFWLGDTWWMGLTKRLGWPEDFQALAADRVAKGFTVIQIVAGFYPDMDWGDERGENEAGLPYNADFTALNPAYFDMADLKIRHLVKAGLTPCIVGCWAYFIKWMGIEKMKRHWRYIIARWGAYPVVWCLAGEATMPYYLSETPEQDGLDQKAGWTELGHYVRATDPLHRLTTIHTMERGRNDIEDDSVIDFQMLQTGHSNRECIPHTVKVLTEEYTRAPLMPVLNSELNYEGIRHTCYDDIQRTGFWICMLSGAAGHTYGANGIWQVNTAAQPYGASPHGNNWGNQPWDTAMHFPGSGQLGLGKAILQRYAWPEFQPHQKWVTPAASAENAWDMYAAGIPRQVRIIYMPGPVVGRIVSICHLEADVRYEAKFINPTTGEETVLGPIEPDANAQWLVPFQPEMRDWLLVLEARE